MSNIKCPYCGAENSGEFPFCKECGRVLPMGDEIEVVRESVGATFEWRWVFVGGIVIFVLTTLIISLYAIMDWDLSFMKPARTMRIDEPHISSVTPEWIITPSPTEMTISINTRGRPEFTPEHAMTTLLCGKTAKTVPRGNSKIRAEKISLLGIEFIRYTIPPEGDVLVKDVPICDKSGFHDVSVKFENGKKLYKYDAVYVSPVQKPWFAFYMDLSMLKLYFNNEQLKPVELAMEASDEFKGTMDELVKILHKLQQEQEQMKLVSFGFWGLFLFEILAFLLGGIILGWMSPGISIKESIVAGMLMAALLIVRNIFFFHAGGSYMVFQLLIMFPLYSAATTLGGYLGEKIQGTI